MPFFAILSSVANLSKRIHSMTSVVNSVTKMAIYFVDSEKTFFDCSLKKETFF